MFEHVSNAFFFSFLESSQAAKNGGCFSSDNTVQTFDRGSQKVSEIQIGERVLALDPLTNRWVFSEVIMFLDWDPMSRRPFLKASTSSGRTVTVTGNHLVMTGSVNSSRTVFAERLRVGDTLLVKGDNSEEMIEDVIVQIKTVVRTGIYAPLTSTGTIVVNNVVASCYAVVDSQSLAHWAFAPMRLVSNARASIKTMWRILTMKSFEVADFVTPKGTPTRGVHWYPKTLYSVAQYLLPWHMLLN